MMTWSKDAAADIEVGCIDRAPQEQEKGMKEEENKETRSICCPGLSESQT